MATYQYRAPTVTPSSAATRRIDTRSSPSASSSATAARTSDPLLRPVLAGFARSTQIEEGTDAPYR
ncbi:hypothetical protein GCM10023320_29410 [Pseudonocardia adelaidensis]|uniref:FXSXX-COOH protein n=1 Tax=Pseudonocardia adelaidensis TaxID=648754 RepID=A0ABP9NI37_9PSEU